jgi:hypothetical protein
MATVSVVKIKVRRGTDNDRKLITLDVGELGYVQDVASRRLFVGDGSTKGGNPAGAKIYSGDFINDPTNLTTTQVGDIVFNSYDNRLYCLTGVDVNNFPNFDNQDAYQFIGTRADNNTIEYTSTGFLQVKDYGVTREKINDNLFDITQGIYRDPSGTISVKYDNSTIKINGSGELYVDPANINITNINVQVPQADPINAAQIYLSNLPSSNLGLTSGRLWRDAAAGGVLRVV